MTTTFKSFSIYEDDDTAAITVVNDFVLSFESPCDDPALTKITTEVQTNPPNNNYNDTPFEFTWVSFTVVPSFCDLTVSCVSVSPTTSYIPCQQLDVDDKLTF